MRRRWFPRRPDGGNVRPAVGLVFLLFVAVPVVDAATSGPHRGLAVAGAVVFVTAYAWLVVIWTRVESRVLLSALLAVMLTVAMAMTVGLSSSWGYLFAYSSACAAVAAPSGLAFVAVLVCTALAAAGTLLGGGSAGAAAGYAASAIGVGLLMVLMRDLRSSNAELTEARAELARTAVAAERERFARDLHDLLGHTLSVIAIKAELAGRLLPERVDDAAAEVADVEQVARQALGEVRLAVSGYRLPTLDRELAGARMALSAAGIEASVERASVSLDPEVEAVLAWAVREGATNVIRHSSARHCTFKVVVGLDGAEVEVVDDGGGDPGAAAGAGAGVSNGHAAGHGLAGLGERARGLRGDVSAGPLPGGGFRLAVSVPVPDRAARP